MNRGDLKWPPEHTRKQMLEEEQELQQIAEGPKVRPKKMHKVIKLCHLPFSQMFFFICNCKKLKF